MIPHDWQSGGDHVLTQTAGGDPHLFYRPPPLHSDRPHFHTHTTPSPSQLHNSQPFITRVYNVYSKHYGYGQCDLSVVVSS